MLIKLICMTITFKILQRGTNPRIFIVSVEAGT